MSALRCGLAALVWIWLAAASDALAQAIETNWFPQVVSREYSIHVGGLDVPAYKELVSPEFSVFVGDDPAKPYQEAVSREISIVVTTPAVPARVSPLVATPTPTGETVTLSWAGYNEWAQKDIVGYRIYLFTRGFNDITGMTNIAWVPGETFSITLTNLTPWEDHFFAVVAVDALGGFDPMVNAVGAYVIAKEVASREFSVFVGGDAGNRYQEAVSREVSIVVTTPAWPEMITNLMVTATPTGESATLSWAGYNEWAQKDVVGYRIYLFTRGFDSVAGMTNIAWVPGETFTLTLTNLTPWEDHYFAVVAVDALAGFNPAVKYAAAYVIAKEVVSRELSVFVGDDPAKPYQEVVSREVSIVVPDDTVPAAVTNLVMRDSVNSFSALDLDWTAYNEVGQKDVVRYRVYLGPTYFNDVSALSPVVRVPAETKRCTISGLVPYGVYFVAVVAEDVLGQFNPAVGSHSVQASVDRVKEVRGLYADCGTNSLTFNWQPPDGADPRSNNFLVAYYATCLGVTNVLDRWATSYRVTNLSAAQGYPFQIQTLDSSNRLSEGATLLAATLAPNPSQTVAHTFYGITRVSWEELEPTAVIDSFQVFMAETNFTSVAGLTPVASTRGYLADFSLAVGKTYWFAVASQNIGSCPSTSLPVRVIAHTPGGSTDPTVLAPGIYANGVFNITVNGPIGAEYILQGSENLRDWLPLRTNSPAVMPYTVTVTNEPGLNRFYRVWIR